MIVPERLEALLGAPVHLTELKHKPGRRRTLEAAGSRRHAIVKVYASGRAPTVAARVRALADGPSEPLVPEVLMLDPAGRCVVFSRVPGAPLREALLSHEERACERAGAALGQWHAHWLGQDVPGLVEHPVERELEILETAARGAPGVVAAGIREARIALAAGWSCSTAVHRDLYEEQVLVGDAVGLIDLDDAALGPPELDLGNLLAHITLLEARTGEDLDGVAGALLHAYSDTGPALDADLLAWCSRLTLLRLACIHDLPALAAPQGAMP